jgi:hypothetical protein
VFRKALLFLPLLLLVACLPDTVELSYRFEEGATQMYRMTAHAEASWDVAGRGHGSYDVSFEVNETVQSVDEDGAVVVVKMIPDTEEAKESGLPSPGLEQRTFSLRLGPNGEVLEVLQLDGIRASVLDHDELAFIGTYRPPLPKGKVRLQDEWSDEREVLLGSTLQQIERTATLSGFRADGGSDLALIRFTGRSPLEWITSLPQGDAQLTGEASTRGRASFDIDGGSLDGASSTTTGRFDVRVLPGEGAAPIAGTLRLDLELRVTRVG